MLKTSWHTKHKHWRALFTWQSLQPMVQRCVLVLMVGLCLLALVLTPQCELRVWHARPTSVKFVQ